MRVKGVARMSDVTVESLQAELADAKAALEKATNTTDNKDVLDRLSFLEGENKTLIGARDKAKEEKRKAESILKQQQELNKKIEELNKEFKMNNQREQEYQKEAENILEKQQQIEKMYNELMNDEMKQLMKT